MIKKECLKCGGGFSVQPHRIKEGKGKYCKQECRRKAVSINGFNRTKFHKTWLKLKGRCQCKTDHKYKDYGGRGIKVCDKWQKFLGFKEDMYPSYLKHIEKFGKKNTSIDRINNNGNYCKNNCRWATPIEQANNKRNNVILEYKGEKKTLTQWARKFDINEGTLRSRINRTKWSVEKSLETPIRKY